MFVREGDQFVVTRLDRLARSVLDLSQITAEIANKTVDLIVLDQAIDTGSPTGRLLFHMLAAIGEFERDLIKERAAEGIARAKAAGVKFGARRKLSADEEVALRREFKSGAERTELGRRYGISRAQVYRIWSRDPEAAPDKQCTMSHSPLCYFSLDDFVTFDRLDEVLTGCEDGHGIFLELVRLLDVMKKDASTRGQELSHGKNIRS
jgi:DNA invertase Pin-like site-specific DNA recombinase